eukprot:scaffold774_cov248-Pinguiococcus_pyrenoidosus.AAC.8
MAPQNATRLRPLRQRPQRHGAGGRGSLAFPEQTFFSSLFIVTVCNLMVGRDHHALPGSLPHESRPSGGRATCYPGWTLSELLGICLTAVTAVTNVTNVTGIMLV